MKGGQEEGQLEVLTADRGGEGCDRLARGERLAGPRGAADARSLTGGTRGARWRWALDLAFGNNPMAWLVAPSSRERIFFSNSLVFCRYFVPYIYQQLRKHFTN